MSLFDVQFTVKARQKLVKDLIQLYSRTDLPVTIGELPHSQMVADLTTLLVSLNDPVSLDWSPQDAWLILPTPRGVRLANRNNRIQLAVEQPHISIDDFIDVDAFVNESARAPSILSGVGDDDDDDDSDYYPPLDVYDSDDSATTELAYDEERDGICKGGDSAETSTNTPFATGTKPHLQAHLNHRDNIERASFSVTADILSHWEDIESDFDEIRDDISDLHIDVGGSADTPIEID